MPVAEITEIPPLTAGEQSLIDAHSLLNTLGVLQGELQVVGLQLADDPELCPKGLQICAQMVASLSDRRLALAEAGRVDEYETVVFLELAELVARAASRGAQTELEDSFGNLRSVFAILKVRASEILARAAQPGRWETVSPLQLVGEVNEFCLAVVKNAKGRFGMTYNAARQRPQDYYVDLKVESDAPDGLSMPLSFRDVVRDLFANARKYTRPGGSIIAAVYEDPQHLHLVVGDTGRGIPPDELHTVVQFGKRASNVTDVRTLGGGFGLTKAFMTTKQFGGRFWIESDLGVGTKIRLQIPRAPAR